MQLICSDLEGVFVPEIWINVAEKTGIEELRLTTRDISDYDLLMKQRLELLETHNLKLKDIQEVIATMDPLPGALEIMNWMRRRTQVVVVSDTFTQFAAPLMEKLGWPTLLCNNLVIDDMGRVADYRLRQSDGKRKVVEAFNSLAYEVIAMGDSYNDITMLQTAAHGILFCPPANVIEEYPELPVTRDYDQLREALAKVLK
jgi:phosphoserine/homoserine phosphotransferase